MKSYLVWSWLKARFRLRYWRYFVKKFLFDGSSDCLQCVWLVDYTLTNTRSRSNAHIHAYAHTNTHSIRGCPTIAPHHISRDGARARRRRLRRRQLCDDENNDGVPTSPIHTHRLCRNVLQIQLFLCQSWKMWKSSEWWGVRQVDWLIRWRRWIYRRNPVWGGERRGLKSQLETVRRKPNYRDSWPRGWLIEQSLSLSQSNVKRRRITEKTK